MKTSDSEKNPSLNKAGKSKRKPLIKHGWLLILVGGLVSLIFGNVAALSVSTIFRLNGAIALGIVVLIFPLVAGASLNHLSGSHRPWSLLLLYFLITLLLCAIIWSINTYFS